MQYFHFILLFFFASKVNSHWIFAPETYLKPLLLAIAAFSGIKTENPTVSIPNNSISNCGNIVDLNLEAFHACQDITRIINNEFRNCKRKKEFKYDFPLMDMEPIKKNSTCGAKKKTSIENKLRCDTNFYRVSKANLNCQNYKPPYDENYFFFLAVGVPTAILTIVTIYPHSSYSKLKERYRDWREDKKEKSRMNKSDLKAHPESIASDTDEIAETDLERIIELGKNVGQHQGPFGRVLLSAAVSGFNSLLNPKDAPSTSRLDETNKDSNTELLPKASTSEAIDKKLLRKRTARATINETTL